MVIRTDQILRLPLLPLLAAQGVWVGVRAMKLPEPPGARSGQDGEGQLLRVLILGDSSAAGVGAGTQDSALSGRLSRELAPDFALDWYLEAETSATSKTSLDKLERLPERNFDIAILIHGVNDTTRATPRKTFRNRQAALMDHLAARHGVRRFILSGVPPLDHFPLLPQPLRWFLGRHAARLDDALAGLAADRPEAMHLPLDLPYEPRFTAVDGFHPSEEAYAVWARLLADLIRDQAASGPAGRRI